MMCLIPGKLYKTIAKKGWYIGLLKEYTPNKHYDDNTITLGQNEILIFLNKIKDGNLDCYQFIHKDQIVFDSVLSYNTLSDINILEYADYGTDKHIRRYITEL